MSNVYTPKLRLSNNAEFMKVLRGRVSETLGKRPGKDDPRIYIKSLVIVTWMTLSYLMALYAPSGLLKVIGSISLGISSAGLGFNLFHDAGHGSLSSNKSVNKFFCFFSSSLIGPGGYFWRHKHNYLHHQYPNIQNYDDDLETRDGLRLGPEQDWSIRYKYQHIYAPIIYSLTSLEWFFIKDYVQYFSLKMNKWQSIPKMKMNDHFDFWFSKAIYYTLTLVLPLMIFSGSEFIIGFLLYHFALSLTMASIFQLAHVMEETEFPIIDKEEGKIKLGWAELQLATTVNFAPNSKFVTWFSGGLNYQVEHHIFPNISHTYYPVLSVVLEKTCKEFGFAYHSIPSYSGAVVSHLRALKKLGYYGDVKTFRELSLEK